MEGERRKQTNNKGFEEAYSSPGLAEGFANGYFRKDGTLSWLSAFLKALSITQEKYRRLERGRAKAGHRSLRERSTGWVRKEGAMREKKTPRRRGRGVRL